MKKEDRKNPQNLKNSKNSFSSSSVSSSNPEEEFQLLIPTRKIENLQKTGKSQKLEKFQKTQKNEKTQKTQKNEKSQKSQNSQKTEKTEKKPQNIKKIITTTLLLLLILYYLYTTQKTSILNYLSHKIRTIAETPSNKNTIILISIQLIFSWFMLPGLTYIDVIMTALMKNNIKAFDIIFWGTYGGGLFCFCFIRLFSLKNHFLGKYGKMTIFKVFNEETKKNPYKVSFFVNMLLIPSVFKNILLPLTDMTFLQFALPKFPPYLISSVMIVSLGSQIENFEEFVKNGGGFGEEKSFVEVLDFYLTLAFLVFTFGGMAWGGVLLKRKCDEFEEREKEEREMGEEEEDEEVRCGV